MGDGKYTQSLIISRAGEVLGSDFRGITTNEIDNLPANVRSLGSLFLVRDGFCLLPIGRKISHQLTSRDSNSNGLITSLDQSASDFITEWQNDDRSNISIIFLTCVGS